MSDLLKKFSEEDLLKLARSLKLSDYSYKRLLIQHIISEEGRKDKSLRSITESPIYVNVLLGSKTVKELKEMAKKHGLAGYSRMRKAELVKLLQERDITSPITGSTYEFLEAMELEDATTIKRLMKEGESPDAVEDGRSMISLAIEYRQPKIVKLLIDHGADVNNAGDSTPALIHALLEKNVPIAKLLLKNGANPNATQEEWNGTALIIAATENLPNVVKELLKLGADVDSQDAEGQTALIWATSNGNTKSVGYLLEAGADSNIRDKSGDTALKVAKLKKSRKIQGMLEDYGARE